MDNVERKNSDENDVFPQLTRFNPIRINAERVLLGSGLHLESVLEESVALRVEREEDLGTSVAPKVRVIVLITFNAKWRQKVTEEYVANFSATYRASFHFKDDIDAVLVDKCASKKSYRDFLVAQAYPLARTHMLSELRMMGINSNRKIGFDIYDGDFVQEMPQSAPQKKPRARKKTLPA